MSVLSLLKLQPKTPRRIPNGEAANSQQNKSRTEGKIVIKIANDLELLHEATQQ